MLQGANTDHFNRLFLKLPTLNVKIYYLQTMPVKVSKLIGRFLVFAPSALMG